MCVWICYIIEHFFFTRGSLTIISLPPDMLCVVANSIKEWRSLSRNTCRILLMVSRKMCLTSRYSHTKKPQCVICLITWPSSLWLRQQVRTGCRMWLMLFTTYYEIKFMGICGTTYILSVIQIFEQMIDLTVCGDMIHNRAYSINHRGPYMVCNGGLKL